MSVSPEGEFEAVGDGEVREGNLPWLDIRYRDGILDCFRDFLRGLRSAVPGGFLSLQPIDLRVGSLDERGELRHLGGVFALLVFAEAEEIGAVRGAELVEEEVVLFEDDGPNRQEMSHLGLRAGILYEMPH